MTEIKVTELIEILKLDSLMNEDDKRIESFLEKLSEENDITTRRLMRCIMIDCNNSIKTTGTTKIEDNAYLRNLKKCILEATNCKIDVKSFPHGLSNRWKFAWSQSNMSLEEITPCVVGKSKGRYFRVYNFSNYMKWVVGINKEINLGADIFDGDPDETLRLYTQFSSLGKYRKCKITRLGYNRFVFVGDSAELESIGYGNVERIVDSLGLYVNDIDTNQAFVCLSYDSEFHFDTWQPDALTGDWGGIQDRTIIDGNDFYLSYFIEDAYGRTYSVSGKAINLKERVHLPFDEKGTKIFEMDAIDMGMLTSPIIKCTEAEIIQEADRRYNSSKL